jgi:heme/copper-type cytochrome/quinol oxidase subunit 3
LIEKEVTEKELDTPKVHGIDYTGKKIGMWFFLFTELLFFGGMFLLYSIYRYRFAADFHVAAMNEILLIGSVNTAVLLTSSLSMAMSISMSMGHLFLIHR